MKYITSLTEEHIRSWEIIDNKVVCAKQALHSDAVPFYAPKSAAEKYFREAIFVLADAQYLQDKYWYDLAQQYNIEQKDLEKLYVDFRTSKLFLME